MNLKVDPPKKSNTISSNSFSDARMIWNNFNLRDSEVQEKPRSCLNNL